MLNLEDEQALTPPSVKHARQIWWSRFRRKSESKSFKPIEGRNGPTTFLPLSPKIGGQVNNDKHSIGQYLTREQANFVYKKE